MLGEPLRPQQRFKPSGKAGGCLATAYDHNPVDPIEVDCFAAGHRDRLAGILQLAGRLLEGKPVEHQSGWVDGGGRGRDDGGQIVP